MYTYEIGAFVELELRLVMQKESGRYSNHYFKTMENFLRDKEGNLYQVTKNNLEAVYDEYTNFKVKIVGHGASVTNERVHVIKVLN